MDSVVGVRREVLAKFLAGFVVVVGMLAASAGTAYAKHGADDGRRHHHARHHHARHHHHGRHGADDGPRHN